MPGEKKKPEIRERDRQRAAARRASESPVAREARLQQQRERQQRRRASESPAAREARLQQQRERQQRRRAAESPDVREVRLQQHRQEDQQRRAAESPDDYLVRLVRQRQQQQQHRAAESPDDYLVRLFQQRQQQQQRRAAESPAVREARLQQHCQQERKRRAAEDPEVHQAQLQERRQRRAVEDPEVREARLQQQREQQQRRRAAESPDVREVRLRQHSQEEQQRRATESPDDFLVRLFQQRQQQQRRRAAESPAVREARLQLHCQQERKRRAAEDPEVHQAQLQERRQRRAAEDPEVHQAQLQERRQRRAAEDPEVRQAQLQERKKRRIAETPREARLQQRKKRRMAVQAALAETKVIPDFSTSLEVLRKPDCLDFEHFERNVETAAVLFHLNRGVLHLQAEDEEALGREIEEEILTDSELEDLAQKMETARDAYGSILCCGACGIRGDPCTSMFLKDLDVLAFTDDDQESRNEELEAPAIQIPTSNDGDWEGIHLSDLRSAYDSVPLGKTYHIHPELVHWDGDKEATYVCDTCKEFLRIGTIPTFSVRNVDFGYYQRLGLTMPNVMEQTILARARLYRKIIIIDAGHGSGNQSSLRSQMVVFGHDAPSKAAEVLDANKLKDMSFLFHGANKQEIDRLTVETFRTAKLTARGFVLYQWLRVWLEVNRLYSDITLPSLEQMNVYAAQQNDLARKNALEKDTVTILEQSFGDDVAGVRTGANDDGNGMPAVFTTRNISTEESSEALLRTVAAAIGEDASHVISSTRSSTKYNEFRDNDTLLCHVFPYIFMYGRTYANKAGLTQKQVEHLLRQFTNVPAMSKELLFLLCNQMTRHSNIRGMSARVKGNQTSFEYMAKQILTKSFRTMLKEAIANPTSAIAKKVLNMILPILLVAGKNNPIGGVSASQFTKHCYAMTRHYGAGSVFFTIAPDDINNPTTFRLALRVRNNTSFPSVVKDEDAFFNAMMEESALLGEGDIAIPAGWKQRAEGATANSVATAREYMKLIDNILYILFGGLMTEDKKKKTRYFRQQNRGIFGHLMAGLGVNEVQARGALHMHFILFGGLTPDLLQRAADLPNICKKVAKALDTMFRAEIDRQYHIANLIGEHLPVGKKLRRKYPALLMTRQSVKTCNVCGIAMSYIKDVGQIHRHGFTCHKPPNGQYYCRLCAKFGFKETTGIVQLDQDEHGNVVVYDEVQPPDVNRNVGPITMPDRRMLVWELARNPIEPLPAWPLFFTSKKDQTAWILATLQESVPNYEWERLLPKLQGMNSIELARMYQEVSVKLPEQNGYVVDYNPLATAVTGSNTCVRLLGNTVQSHATLFYLSDYLTKNKASLAHTLTVVNSVQKEIEQPGRGSTAPNAGEDVRTVQHWMTRVLNKLDMALEISDTQAAAALLGLKTELATEKFVLVGIKEALVYLKFKRNKGSVASEPVNKTNATQQQPQNVPILDEIAMLTEQLAHTTDGESDWGPATIFRIRENEGMDPTIVYVSFPEYYHYRGETMRNLNRIEYACLVEYKRRGEVNEEKQLPGREATPLHPYGRGFKLEGSHIQLLRSKQYVPMLTGSLPPLPDLKTTPHPDDPMYPTWKKKADAFGGYYLTAIRPEINDYDDDHRDLTLQYNWESFQTFVEDLRQRENHGDFIAKARLNMMFSIMFGMHSENKAKVTMKMYRSRMVDFWDDIDRLRFQGEWKLFEEQQMNSMLESTDGLLNLPQDCLRPTARDAGIQQISFSDDIVGGLPWSLEEIGNGQPPVDDSVAPLQVEMAAWPYTGKKTIEQTLEMYQTIMKEEDAPVGISSKISHHANSTSQTTDLAELRRRAENLIAEHERKTNKPWTRSQRRIFDELIAIISRIYMNGGKPLEKDSPIILCTGGPGTGKTTVLNYFAPVADVMEVLHIIRSTYMGVAAVLADGQTFFKLFQVGFGMVSETATSVHQLKPEDVNKLRARLGITSETKVLLLVLDEGSMITPPMFALLNSRLQQVTGVETTMGGIPVFLFGDFSQLPPVGKGSTSLAAAAVQLAEVDVNLRRMKANVDLPVHERKPVIRHTKKRKRVLPDTSTQNKFSSLSLFRRGVELFTRCKWLPLEEQVRSLDPEHTAFLQAMGKGEPIKMEQLRNYKVLGKEDMMTSKWATAPILVAMNREKIDLTDIQARRFAKLHGTHVIRWQNPLVQWIEGPQSKELKKHAVNNDPAFWQYFVALALAHINHNLNPSQQIANGTPVRLHSLMIRTRQAKDWLEAQQQSLPPGSVISLLEPPLAVNVELFYNDNEVDNARRKAWKGPTLIKDRVVIPLLKGNRSWYNKEKNDHCFFIRPGKIPMGYPISKIQNYPLFPFDLAFAMTFHKAQGRTLEQIILVLSERTAYRNLRIIQFASIFVALSRVRRGEDIRILMPSGRDLSSLAYLTELKADPAIQQFFAGFKRDPNCWNQDDVFEAILQYHRDLARS